MQHSTTQPRIAAIPHPHVSKKSTFVIALAFFGVTSILSGIVSIVSVIILLSQATMPDPVSTMLIEIAYEISLGALILVSARAFVKGKLISLWLYGGSLAIDSLYHLKMGYPLNYLFVGFGLLLIWQILNFRSELELS